MKRIFLPKWKLPLFLLSAVILGLWVALEIPCPIRSLTGVICPGCGMSRAWLACLRLDFIGAFSYHPMFWAVPVVAIYLLFDCRLFSKPLLNGMLPCGILLGIAVCYIIRLAAFFAGTLPL